MPNPIRHQATYGRNVVISMQQPFPSLLKYAIEMIYHLDLCLAHPVGPLNKLKMSNQKGKIGQPHLFEYALKFELWQDTFDFHLARGGQSSRQEHEKATEKSVAKKKKKENFTRTQSDTGLCKSRWRTTCTCIQTQVQCFILDAHSTGGIQLNWALERKSPVGVTPSAIHQVGWPAVASTQKPTDGRPLNALAITLIMWHPIRTGVLAPQPSDPFNHAIALPNFPTLQAADKWRKRSQIFNAENTLGMPQSTAFSAWIQRCDFPSESRLSSPM